MKRTILHSAACHTKNLDKIVLLWFIGKAIAHKPIAHKKYEIQGENAQKKLYIRIRRAQRTRIRDRLIDSVKCMFVCLCCFYTRRA